MEQVLSLQQLTDKLLRLESEIELIRRALLEHSQQNTPALTSTVKPMPGFRWADKQTLQREMNAFRASLSIRTEPIEIEDLQRRMGEAGFAPNELSQSIIEAREK
ncbi:MAG: hypothetical protein N2559_10475 [Anaerolineae bacterium]|nr:hypothetical protein [Anaerolineae bacterium]